MTENCYWYSTYALKLSFVITFGTGKLKSHVLRHMLNNETYTTVAYRYMYISLLKLENFSASELIVSCETKLPSLLNILQINRNSTITPTIS